MLTDFQNSFTDRLSGKFAIKPLSNIPPHLRYVSTLPCEIFMFRNCLFLLKNMLSAWDNQSSGTWDTCVYLARLVTSKQPRPKPSWLQNLGRNAATCLPHKSPGWNDLKRRLINVWADMQQSVIDDAIWPVAEASARLCSSQRRTFWACTLTRKPF